MRKSKVVKIRYMAFVLGVFILFFALGAGVSTLVQVTSKMTDDTASKEEAGDNGERINILVLGVDKRPGDESSRSDTMILTSIDPELKKIALLSIPRDTRIDVPGSPLDKICTANYAGGPECAVEIAEKLLDTNIDHYVEMDFKGFETMIDTLDGITINVPQRMYTPTEGIDLQPGTRKLNGKQALGLVRYREGYTFADIDRTAMQQEFLMVLADEILQPKTIGKLPALAKEMSAYVKTDMEISDMIAMANLARKFDSSAIITQTLPGYFHNIYNDQDVLEQSYWIVDEKEAASMLENMFAGKTVEVIRESPHPPHVPKPKKDKQEDENINNENQDPDDQNQNIPSPGNAEETKPDDNTPGTVNTGPEGYI